MKDWFDGWGFWVVFALFIAAIIVGAGIISRAQEKPSGCDNPKIKGNINMEGEKIYHEPGDKFYGATQIDTSQGEKWFCTTKEAEDAGWRAAKV